MMEELLDHYSALRPKRFNITSTSVVIPSVGRLVADIF